MSITIYTLDGQTKLFPIDKFLRKAVTEWLGYPAVKFYTTENGEDETNTFLPDTIVFAIPYIPDDSRGADMFKACEQGDVKEVNKLISQCANVNVRDNDMYTPLHYVTSKGYDTIVDILLKNGADIDVQNNDGDSPYDYAEDGGFHTIVNMLRTVN